jgi:hypothetical protein
VVLGLKIPRIVAPVAEYTFNGWPHALEIDIMSHMAANFEIPADLPTSYPFYSPTAVGFFPCL